MLPVKGVFRKQIFKVILEVDLFLRNEIKIGHFSFAVSSSNIRILSLFIRWWFRTRRLLQFFDNFCLILFFHIWDIARINWAHWKCMSLSGWYWYFNVCHFFDWQDSSTNWSTKLILLSKFGILDQSVIYNYMLVKP